MKPKKIPMRMCVGCREMKPKRELIRVVRSPEGAVSMDTTGKKPGRGAYLCRDAACLARALKQKQLERQLEVQLTPEVVEQLQATMANLPAPEPGGSMTDKKAHGLLGLCVRAGQAVLWSRTDASARSAEASAGFGAFLTRDASDNARKRLHGRLCRYYQVPLCGDRRPGLVRERHSPDKGPHRRGHCEGRLRRQIAVLTLRRRNPRAVDTAKKRQNTLRGCKRRMTKVKLKDATKELATGAEGPY